MLVFENYKRQSPRTASPRSNDQSGYERSRLPNDLAERVELLQLLRLGRQLQQQGACLDRRSQGRAHVCSGVSCGSEEGSRVGSSLSPDPDSTAFEGRLGLVSVQSGGFAVLLESAPLARSTARSASAAGNHPPGARATHRCTQRGRVPTSTRPAAGRSGPAFVQFPAASRESSLDQLPAVPARPALNPRPRFGFGAGRGTTTSFATTGAGGSGNCRLKTIERFRRRSCRISR